MGEPLRTGLVGEEADAIMGAAQRAGPRVGRAPDTVLGPGTRTARKAVDAHGSEGSLPVPDPNTFDGSVEPWRGGAREPLPPSAGYAGSARGYGLAGLAWAPEAGRPHRASAEFARHVLDVMLTLRDADRERTSLPAGTTCSRPEPVPFVGELSASAGHG
ncbi:hypothetical protein AB0M05_09975 [Streptomyces violaceusniger]|uniref:hypothetical protein n=1 Tax=Streptomyces violaceusniger TaxID=68280 RepID=UPI00344A931B